MFSPNPSASNTDSKISAPVNPLDQDVATGLLPSTAFNQLNQAVGQMVPDLAEMKLTPLVDPLPYSSGLSQPLMLREGDDLLELQSDSMDSLTGEVANVLAPTETGIFTVGDTGKVDIDFLLDSGIYRGEVGIFSLSEMNSLEAGSTGYIQEAAKRILSGTEQGHIVLSDRDEGARFSGALERRDYAKGEHQGARSVSLLPGDQVGLMLVPNGTIQSAFDRPRQTGSRQPFFSFSEANPDNAVKLAQVVPGLFAWEERRASRSSESRDYNDVIFQMKGVDGQATPIETVVDAEEDWRSRPLGKKVIDYVNDIPNPEEVATGEIRGTKWNDLNGNGVFDSLDTQKGRIVVGQDVNTFATRRAGAQEALFATNVAEWLIGGTEGKILAIESNASDFGRDYAPVVESAWDDAGFDVTVTGNTNFTLSDLQRFDAVFLGATFPEIGIVDNQVLIDYVNAGGNVYLYGGVRGNAQAEASNWNTFLNAFGLEFEDQYNNLFFSEFNNAHPIFEGVTQLNNGIGLPIQDLEPLNPKNQVLQSINGENLYAVYSSSDSTSLLPDSTREPGLAGITVYLDSNKNGILDPDEPTQVTQQDDPATPNVDETGDYAFTNLKPGNYQVREVVPDGFTQTAPGNLSGDNLIANGSFESGNPKPSPTFFSTIGAGAKQIDSWTILGETIDYVSSGYWEASDGSLSIDLSGTPGKGGVSQTFDTVPGQLYRVTFDLAGNTEGGPAIKGVEVKAAEQSERFEFDISGKTRTQMGWETETWEFTAIDETTTLEFIGTTNSQNFGAVIDNIQVNTMTSGFYSVDLVPGEVVDKRDFGNVKNEEPIPNAPPTITSAPVVDLNLSTDGKPEAVDLSNWSPIQYDAPLGQGDANGDIGSDNTTVL